MPKSRIVLALVTLTLVALAAPERWSAAIEKFTTADLEKPPAPGGIVFVGSSSIARWSTLAEDFPGRLVLNRGFGGSQLADSVFYADRIVIPYAPKTVVLYSGENDLNAGKSPATVHADFRAFVIKIREALPEVRIIYIAMKPSPSRWKLRESFVRGNALIAEECAGDQRLVFLDVWSAMLDANGGPRAELFVQDKLHLNAGGYAIWKKLLAPLLYE